MVQHIMSKLSEFQGVTTLIRCFFLF